MKNLTVLATVAALVVVAVAFAQTQPVQPIQPIQPQGNTYNAGGGWPGSYHSSTAAEGRLRGMGDLTRSKGQANLDNSAAAINYSVARRSEIENHREYTSAYFDMRAANRQARAEERGPRTTMEEAIRFAQAGMPKPLSPGELNPVSGQISWPSFLRLDSFGDDRAEVDSIFAQRAATGAIGADDFMKVRSASNAMIAELKKQVREIPPDQYMIAKRFIESVAYEAGRPAA